MPDPNSLDVSAYCWLCTASEWGNSSEAQSEILPLSSPVCWGDLLCLCRGIAPNHCNSIIISTFPMMKLRLWGFNELASSHESSVLVSWHNTWLDSSVGLSEYLVNEKCSPTFTHHCCLFFSPALLWPTIYSHCSNSNTSTGSSFFSNKAVSKVHSWSSSL
jgi:hypothetical protein